MVFRRLQGLADFALICGLPRLKSGLAGLCIGVLALLPACDAQCPAGTVQVGKVCKTQTTNIGPAGGQPQQGVSADPSAMSGGAPPTQAGTAGLTGTGSAMAGSTGLAGQAGTSATNGVSMNVAGTNAGMSSAVAGHSGGTGSTAGSGAPMSVGSMGICAGHANESICEGPVMHHCSPTGESASPETCTSPTLCQVGLASKTCAVCSPGTFHCSGAQPQACTDAGQYMSMPACASVALCNETTGTCTDMKCQPKAKSCAPDGTLKTCNDTGSDFNESLSVSCGKDMCDAKGFVCYKCTPNAVTCSGQNAMKCSSDGQTMTLETCKASNDCIQAACRDGTGCTTGDNEAPLKSCSSSGGHQCDGAGHCLGCVDASVCGGKKCGPRNTCVACTVPTDCTSSDCTDPVCNADGSCGAPRNKGTTASCGNAGGHCDGNGGCTLCGNGTLDVPENCDKASPEWSATGFCTNDCKISSAVFRRCTPDSQGRCDSSNPYIFCSAVGSCAWVCNTDADCQTSPSAVARCQRSNPGFCAISCSGPGGACPNGLTCVEFQKSGESPLYICGVTPLVQQ
jgi:hypothetical protein